MESEVQSAHGCLDGAENLEWPVRAFRNGEPQCLCFFQGNPVRFLENVRIDRSMDLDALADVVDRAAGPQGCGKPDT
ncbi:hypothetical protein StrepF001_01870 [Streptomyces sp. F001]|nr:hypothetical protein StrepF001_01870 [Streptomyces sp. F001]